MLYQQLKCASTNTDTHIMSPNQKPFPFTVKQLVWYSRSDSGLFKTNKQTATNYSSEN